MKDNETANEKRQKIIEAMVETGAHTRDEIEERDGRKCTFCDAHLPFPSVNEDHEDDCKKIQLQDMPAGLGNTDDTMPADMQTGRGIAGEINQEKIRDGEE